MDFQISNPMYTKNTHPNPHWHKTFFSSRKTFDSKWPNKKNVLKKRPANSGWPLVLCFRICFLSQKKYLHFFVQKCFPHVPTWGPWWRVYSLPIGLQAKTDEPQEFTKNFLSKDKKCVFLKNFWIPTLPAKVSGFIKNRGFEFFLETFGFFWGGIVYFLNKIKYCWLHKFQFPDFFWSTWLLIRVYFVLLVVSPKVTHRLSHSSFCLLNFIKTTIFSKNVFWLKIASALALSPIASFATMLVHGLFLY